MKRMAGFRLLGALAMAGAAAGMTSQATPLAAQVEQETCRCVDRDGNELDDCTCFRAPRVDRLLSGFGLTTDRPRLGISVDAGQSARRDAEGVLVTDVLRDGPAEDAGLREGDIITAIDGQRMTESIGARAESDFDLDQSAPVQRLLALVGELEEGQEVEVEYTRDGDRQTTIVTAEELDSWGGDVRVLGSGWDGDRLREQLRGLTERAQESRSFFRPDGDSRIRFQVGPGSGQTAVFGPSQLWTSRGGLQVTSMNEGLASYFGVSEGVLVLDAERRTGFGLQAGDVVLEIGRRAVASPEHFHRILGSYDDDEEVEMTVMREGEEITVTGRRRY